MAVLPNMMIVMISLIIIDYASSCKSSNNDKNMFIGHVVRTSNAKTCPHITYAHGLLMNSKGIECKYDINGRTFMTNSMATKIPLHGLLRFKCDGCSGHMIVKGPCSECDECVNIANEHLCLNPSPAFYWGLGTGLIITIVIGLGLYIILRFVENKTSHAGTFRNMFRKKDKESDTETESDNDQVNMNACPPSFMYALCLFCVISPANAIYTTSINKLCSDRGCIDFTSLSVEIGIGSPVYVTLNDGGLLELGISKLEYNDYYRVMYRTSDYKISVQNEYNCKGAGYCWHNEDCRPYSRPGRFNWNNTLISDGGCYEVANSCETFCFYNRACVYYKWVLEQIGDLHQVFSHDFRSWKADLYIKRGNVTTIIRGGSIQDSFDWNEVDYDYPIEMSLKKRVEDNPNKSVINFKGKYADVVASSLGKPMTGLIGDYQINNGHSFNAHSVTCSTTSCETSCRSPTPAIRRLNIIKELDCDMNDGRLVCKSEAKGKIQLTLGVDGVHNEVKQQSECQIQFETTWSCNDCPYPSNVVVRPYNVIQKGHVKIETNCTLDPPYLICSDHPYTIDIIGESKYCYISSSRLNISRVIHIRTIDNQEISPDYGITEYGKQSWNNWSFLTESPRFISGFQNMFNIGLVTILISITIRYALAFYIISKTSKVPQM